MIMNLICYFIGSFFISVATYYVVIKIIDKDFDILNRKIIKWLIIETLFLMIFYLIAPNNIFRMTFNIIIVSMILKKLFHYDISKCFILSFMNFSIASISECILILPIYFIKNYNLIPILYTMNIFTNFFIATFMILIIKNNFIRNIYKNIIFDYSSTYKISNLFLFLEFSLCLSFIFCYIYFDISGILNLFINIFLLACYISFPIILLKEKNNNFKLKLEYDTILKNIDSYEKDLVSQRMRNHENNNMLIAIKGMIGHKDLETVNFINQLLKDNCQDDKDVLYLTRNIPIGGLQGLVYQKLLFMSNNNIEYFINIGNNIKKDCFKKLSIKTVKNICIITGIFIDNAIQAVKSSSNNYISIIMYKKCNYVVIEISNNYEGKIEIDLFDNKGYTTKGKGRGYGLSLVKEIIDSDNSLQNLKEINGNVFTQKILINIEK